GFLGAWILVTLAPTSSVIPIATEVGAERRMYLPLMAIVAGAVLVGDWLSVRASAWRLPSLAAAALTMATAALAMSTVVRNQEDASGWKLAEPTLARWPSPTAHAMVGGELAALGRDLEALPELRIAAPLDPRARYNLGITHFNLGDDAQAIRELGDFVRRFP